jgi:chemotaxis methyl-accepting protein methylase
MPVMPTKPSFLVGIGSSAGGLEAMLKLLPRLRPNSGTRFVVAQHLLKTAHSDLVLRVLGRNAALPLVEARDDEIIEPDRLYLIPSNWNGVVKGGRLRLEAPVPGQLSAPSVNALFLSIAEEAGPHSIGIVLSGAGSDGVMGCRAIKERGGKILLQTAETVLINGMPGAVERAGLADETLSPETMADRVNDLVHPPERPSIAPSPAARIDGSSELGSLIQEVSRASGIDFTSYKEDTLLRRIRGRMKASDISDFQDYATRARRDPAELEILRQLFVVSLSWFFRDREAFDKLRELLIVYLSRKSSGDVVRMWVPGCATGEECFSFAILLTELVEELGLRMRVAVIGSDLNPEALEVAQDGRYAAKAFKEYQAPELLAKYFAPEGGGYRVSDQIRSLCSFRREDVVAANPPPHLDLVSCRNLLIYMKTELQNKMIEKFHRALSSDGLLFLGMSENIGLSGSARFAAVDSSFRIFRRKANGGSLLR